MDSRAPKLWVTLGWLLAISLSASLSSAVELSGSLTSELYTWTEDRVEHLRPYQRLNSNLTLYRSDQNLTVDWQTSLRWTTDLIDKFETDPQLNVYQSYLRLTGLSGRSEIRLGRHFVYNPVGSAFIDGLYIRGLTYSDFSLDLYAGSRVNRLDPESIRSFSDYLNAGSRISWRPNSWLQLIQSFSLARDNGQVEQGLAGLSAIIDRKQARGLVRFVYNPFDRTLHTLSGRLTIPRESWRLSLEAGTIQPTVRANSLFSLINFSRREELRLTMTRNLKLDYRLTGSIKIGLQDENKSTRLAFGLKSYRYYLIWTNQSGDQSSDHGFRAGGNLELFSSWKVFASGGYNSYMVQDEFESDLTAWHIRAGLSKRISSSLDGRAELQLLSNADNKHDTRLLISLSKFFDVGGADE